MYIYIDYFSLCCGPYSLTSLRGEHCAVPHEHVCEHEHVPPDPPPPGEKVSASARALFAAWGCRSSRFERALRLRTGLLTRTCVRTTI